MTLDEIAHDGEPEAETTAERVSFAVHLHERFENADELARSEAATVVAYRDAHAPGNAFDRDLDFPVGRCEFGSIGE